MSETEPEDLSLYYESENQRLQKCITHNQNVFLEACKPPVWLNETEYPMKWLMSLMYRFVVDCQIPDKLNDYKNQGAEYGFVKFCFMLTLLIMNSQIFLDDSSNDDESSDNEEEFDTNDTKKSVEKPESHPLDEYPPEKAYTLCREILDEMARHEGDVMFSRIGNALEYVLGATRAHMLYWKGDIAASQEIAKNLIPVAEMNNENRAGIEGIKGKFILSFYKDPTKALEATLKAVEIDSTFGAWYYQTGKIIRRLRRENREEITEEEIKYFEKAVELERNPKYLVYLAQAYQEMSQFIFKNKEGTTEKYNDLQKKAAELFRESWSLQNNAATICRRIGNGMMKLRGEYQNLDLAKEALQKSVEICDNLATIHQLGSLHYKYLKDDEAALECFKRVAAIFGTGDMIRLKLIRDPSYDPKDEIKYWISISPGLSKQDLLFCEIGWYYLFYKNILTASVLYFWKVLKKDFDSFRVTKFRSCPFVVVEPVNMIKVLVNEIILLKEKDVGPDQKEDITFLEKFLQKVYEKHPQMRELKPNPNLKQHIKNTVDKEIASLRRRRYGNSKNTTVRNPQGNNRWHSNHEPEGSESNWRRVDVQGSEPENDSFRSNLRNVNNEEQDRGNYGSRLKRNSFEL